MTAPCAWPSQMMGNQTMQDTSTAGAAGDASPPPVQLTSREEVLAQCAQAQRTWTERPGRNLVMLFDGTGNILGNQRDTNVVRLMRALQKHAMHDARTPAQLVYYDPGVGTVNSFPVDSWLTQLHQSLQMLAGMALGRGAFENIAEAYEFLVRHYREGDRIFLFGFSRGAFTARAVGGMINAYGLVQPTALSMIPMMVTNYFAEKAENKAGRSKDDFGSDIVTHFSLGRTPLIHFTGVWDTVETIGSGFLGGVRISNPANMGDKRYVHVRHAMAMHEIRCKYKPRRFKRPHFTPAELAQRSFEERWFAGAHSDVGGSYPRDGLAIHSLQWMMDAAIEHGLMVDHATFSAVNADLTMHDQTYESPYWAWTGLSSRERAHDDDINALALPEAPIKAAETLPREAPLLRYLGWLLALAVVLLGVKAAMASAAACVSGSQGAPLPLSNFFQLLSPWHEQLGMQCGRDAVMQALQWEWYLLAAYFLWLPYPVTWALRRLAVGGISRGEVLAPWLANAQWFMLALVASHFMANVATYFLALPAGAAASTIATGVSWLLGGSAAVKIIALGALAAIVGAGAITGDMQKRR